MAQASRNKRKMRRLKRQLSLNIRMLELALQQRNQARALANYLGQTLEDSGVKIVPKVDTPSVEVSPEDPESVEVVSLEQAHDGLAVVAEANVQDN